jgi:hypothetical protein
MDVAQIQKRLLRLERQNRWLKLSGLVILALTALGAVTASEARKVGTVEAEEFVLRDADGNRRAVIKVLGGRTALAFFRDNQPRLVLAESEHFAGLTLNGEEGQPRLTLGTVAQDSALVLNNSRGKARAVLAVGETGDAGLELMDAKEKSVHRVP